MTIVPNSLCMLQVLVHRGCIPNARLACYRLVHDEFTIWTIEIYGIGTIIFLIVTVNNEYHIIVLIACDFVFQISVISIWISFLLVSAELFVVWVSIHVNIALEFVGFTICHPLQLVLQALTLDLYWYSNFRLWSWTGIWIFNWDSDLHLGPTYVGSVDCRLWM